MGIAQIALGHPHSVKQANVEEKKTLQTILASLYTPPLPGNAHGNNTFQKGASLSE